MWPLDSLVGPSSLNDKLNEPDVKDVRNVSIEQGSFVIVSRDVVKNLNELIKVKC